MYVKKQHKVQQLEDDLQKKRKKIRIASLKAMGTACVLFYVFGPDLQNCLVELISSDILCMKERCVDSYRI